MPVFTYKAKKQTGEPVQGTVQAESERAALDALHQQGVFPMELQGRGETEKKEVKPVRRRGLRRKPTADDLSIFTRQLGDLLRAGVALHQALITLYQQTTNVEMAQTIEAISHDVRTGKALHEAMEKHTKIFPHLYTSMIRAGETGGFLQDVLYRLAEFLEKEAELRGRIKAALAYPVLLIVLGTGAVAFLLTFFIPRFATIFEDMGGNLPWMTRVVMAISQFMQEYWILPFAALLMGVAIYKRVSETLAGRRVIDRIRLGTPLFGIVVRKSAVARFSRSLGTLLRCGVPILTALEISREAMGNCVLMEEVEEAAAGVSQGQTLGDMLRGTRTFPPMVSDMVTVGEAGGNLDEVLIQVAEAYDRQVDRAVRTFIALFEPILLLFMAVIVGFIVISMLLPVFTLSSMIR